MLDQNTTTIIASVIAVLGTLGGAITGVLLSNRHTSKMEQLKVEQEIVKRNTAIIEEIYSLLTEIYICTKHNINHERPAGEGIDNNMNRVQTLIYLYLPILKAKYRELRKSVTRLLIEVYDAQMAHNPMEVEDIAHEQLEDFNYKMADIKTELEKLVR